MPTLLIVDDEPSILLAFRRVFRSTPLEVLTAETGGEGLARARERRPDVIVLDVQLPDQTGLDVLRKLREWDARSLVIFITGKSTTDTAIEAMKLGAFEYLLKPLELAQLRQVIERALGISRLMHVPAVVAEAEPVDDRADAIVGRCPAMQEVYKAIGRVAGQDVTVLIAGESGTGKELVARAIYRHSKRAGRPFLAINCAALPEALVESELFGHEQGAFTGAVRQRVGKFEQCDEGTILLDEIGDMPLPVQAKMLRLLQEQRFERVGGNQTLSTRVRVLAATNHDLDRLVAEGKFRSDLYYRLKGVTIAVPALRDRRDDIPLLAQHFLARFVREMGLDVRGFDPAVVDSFLAYPWPGNIRELQGVIRSALVRTSGGVVLPEFLPPAVRGGAAAHGPAPAGAGPCLADLVDAALRDGRGDVYARVLAQVERELLTRALRQTHGHQANASELLGINRATLRAKLRELGIAVDRVVTAPPGPEPG